MTVVNRTKTLILAALTLCAASDGGYAQQWSGSVEESGTIWRSGKVAVGEKPQRGDDPRAQLEVTRPLAASDDLDDRLFSANMVYKGNTSPRFEVDTRHAYAGGARNKAALLAPDLDFAVHRKAAIGVVNINERIPSDYMLVVGGKILAEEVRIKLIEDWSDYVFAKDYPLKSLADVEQFIHANHRLPEIPGATEVEEAGVSLGHMQSKLLLKIEELTLYLIQQNKTIETLQEKLAQLEQENGLR